MSETSDVSRTMETASLSSKLLHEFKVDGSLRDIYVFDTTVANWNHLLEALNNSDYSLEISPPFDHTNRLEASKVFNHVANVNPVCLKMRLASRIDIHCHFFCDEEMEFDIDPRQVDTEADITLILGFMKTIGDTLDKDVFLTPEDTQDYHHATYKPSSGEFVTR